MKDIRTENIRNVAIVGHGAAGKTMLAEHLLFTAGATDRLGTIEGGTTQSDWDPLEARRRLSMASSVLPLEWHGCKINLVDVPGTPDFASELPLVARAVEAMVIVCEAKADLDVGFERAWAIADEYGLARLVFVNKLERDNADYDGLMNELDRRYGQKVVGVQIPIGSGSAFSGVLDVLAMRVYRGRDRGVEIGEIPAAYALDAAMRREKMMDAAADADDALAERYLGGEELSPDEIEAGLLKGVERGRTVPVMVGSAASGLGVATLLDRIVCEMPSPAEAPKDRDGRSVFLGGEPVAGHAPAALCFKTLSDPFLGKVSFLRVLSGELSSDLVLRDARTGEPQRLHHLVIPHGKEHEDVSRVVCGDVCAVTKLGGMRTGDVLTDPNRPAEIAPVIPPRPSFRLAVLAATKGDDDKLPAAMERLLDEDPALRFGTEEATGETVLEGMGSVHLDATIEKLKARYGVTVTGSPAKVAYRETITRKAKAQGRHKRQTGGKGQFGDVWLEIEPLPRGEGFLFESAVVGGAIPRTFFPAIEKGVREEMARGVLAGYPLTDLKVTVTDGSTHDVDSNEAAFRTAGSLALKNAAEAAGAIVLEPYARLTVTTPDESVGDVAGDLNGKRGRLLGMEPGSSGGTEIRALVPAAELATYTADLRAITRGRGGFVFEPAGYEPAPDAPRREGGAGVAASVR